MDKYHINPNGEAGKCTARAGACPFGDDSQHFSTADDARKAYELVMKGTGWTVGHRMDAAEKMASEQDRQWKNALEIVAHPSFDDAVQAWQEKSPPLGTFEDSSMVVSDAIAAIEHWADDNLEERDYEEGTSTTVLDHQWEKVRHGLAEKLKSIQKANQPDLPSSKAKGYTTPDSYQDFAAQVADEKVFPSSSQVILDPQVADNGGYMGGSRFVGGKVKEGEYLSAKDAAKRIREDIVQARKLGEIPGWLTTSVSKDSGGHSITIELGLKVEGSATAFPKDWIETKVGVPRERFPTYKPTEASQKLEKYFQRLGGQFEKSDINSSVDYFNSSNSARVTFRRAWKDQK